MELRKDRFSLSWAFDVMAAMACFAAWLVAWQRTHDLEWPCENDLFRDMGAAQSILDGQGGADPAYLGERWWYNPLVPGVVGMLSRGLGMPLEQAYGTLGTHLNLLAPLGFYAMMAVLFERRAALAGLIGFLFLGPHEHVSWLHATYSPWLWTCNFSQGLFYASTLLVVLAFRRESLALAAAAGVSLGLTLLAHTAPAALLSMAILFVVAIDMAWWRQRRGVPERSLGIGIVVLLSAVAISSPFLFDVVVHLQRGIRNPTPMLWLAGELEVRRIPELAKWHFSVRGVFALLGWFHLLIWGRAYCRYARRISMAWALSTLLALAYGFASQLVVLPPFLPSWHFYFYFHALESVLFGLGVAAVAGVLFRLARRLLLGPRLAPLAFERGVHAVCLIALIVYCGSRYGRYRVRVDIVDNRRESMNFANAPTIELYRWILRHTNPTDVFLAEPLASFYAILAAGRKVVVVQDLFSNPYVDVVTRARDAAAMLGQVRSAQWSEFLATAKPYHLRYVALPASERGQIEADETTALRRILRASDETRGLDLYELRTPSPIL